MKTQSFIDYLSKIDAVLDRMGLLDDVHYSMDAAAEAQEAGLSPKEFVKTLARY